MFNHAPAFSSFSVSNIQEAKKFYNETLGLAVKEENLPGCPTYLKVMIGAGNFVMIYPKVDHVPATFTVLNFPVGNLESSVKEMKQKGLKFETSEDPLIAWFKDPSGNFLSIVQEDNAAMMDGFTVIKSFEASPEKVFKYFTQANLIEKWSYPHDMTLEVPLFEAKVGGHYRYEHTNQKGVFACTGYIKEFIPNQRLVQIDTVLDPTGRMIFDRLECVTEFKKSLDGTEVSVSQSGFPDEESLRDCEASWVQCLKNLERELLTSSFDGGKTQAPSVDREARLN